MHLVSVLTVAVGLYVLGMIVLALVAILGSVRRNRELKKNPPHGLASSPTSYGGSIAPAAWRCSKTIYRSLDADKLSIN